MEKCLKCSIHHNVFTNSMSILCQKVFANLQPVIWTLSFFQPNFGRHPEIFILKTTPAGFLVYFENYISGSLICCKKFNRVKYKPPKGAGGWKGLIKETSGRVWMAPIASKVIKPLNCSSTWTKLIFWLAPIPIKAPPTVSSRPGSQIKL